MLFSATAAAYMLPIHIAGKAASAISGAGGGAGRSWNRTLQIGPFTSAHSTIASAVWWFQPSSSTPTWTRLRSGWTRAGSLPAGRKESHHEAESQPLVRVADLARHASRKQP